MTQFLWRLNSDSDGEIDFTLPNDQNYANHLGDTYGNPCEDPYVSPQMIGINLPVLILYREQDPVCIEVVGG